MRTKSQISNIFQKFIRQVERWSRKKLRHLHTDFGGEFANEAFEEYSAKEGIKWEPSVPYTPEKKQKGRTPPIHLDIFSSIYYSSYASPKDIMGGADKNCRIS